MKKWIQCMCFVMGLLVFMGCESKVVSKEEKDALETKVESVKETILETKMLETEDKLQKIADKNKKESTGQTTAIDTVTQKEPVVSKASEQYCESYDGYCEAPHNPAFYGIWFFASKDSNEAWNAAAECCQKGFEGQMYVTTDWSNLNSEKWYVVTAGAYISKEEAEAMLPYVQLIYPDAYIKYTGEWQG